MRRHIKVDQMKKIGKKVLGVVLWIFGAGVLGFVLLVCFLLFGPKLKSYADRTTFESAQWKVHLNDQNLVKQNMVDDLLSTHQLVGMNRSDIDELLGKPPRTNYFQDYDYVYWLGPERSALAIDSEWLGIMFEKNVVVKAELLAD